MLFWGRFAEIPSAIRMEKIWQLLRTQELELIIRDLGCQITTLEPLRNETPRFKDQFFDKFYAESETVRTVTNEAISPNGSINTSFRKANIW